MNVRSIIRMFALALCFAAAFSCGDKTPENELYDSLFSKARLENLPDDLEKDIRSFLERAEDRSLRSRAAYRYGMTLERKERWAEASEAYAAADDEKFLLRDFARFYRAKAEQELGNYAEAIRLYQSILNEFHDFPLPSTVRLNIGRAYSASEQHEKALAVFETLTGDPDFGRNARFRVGTTQTLLNRPQKAFKAFQALINESTKDHYAKRAVEQIQKLASQHPELKLNRSKSMAHGRVLYGHGDRSGARSMWLSAARGHNDEMAAQARYEIGRSYLRDRNYDKAIETFEAILTRGHANYRTRAQYQRILAHRRKGYRTRALQLFQEFVDQNPRSTLMDDVLMEYGWTLRDNGNYAAAQDKYAKLARRYPSSSLAPEAAWMAAWCEIQLGRYTQGLETLRQLVESYADSKYAGQGMFWVGKMNERLGRWDKAAKAYEETLSMNAWYYSARAETRIQELEREGRVKKGRMEKARRMIAKASVSIEELERMPYERVTLMRSLGDLDAAIAEMTAMLEDNDRGNRARLCYHLRDVYEQAGQGYRSYLMALRFSQLPETQWDRETAPVEIGKLLYPMPYQDAINRAAKEFNVDPRYLAAMMREESHFRKTVASPAGARGLMQVMPETGRWIAQNIGMKSFDTKMLLDPEVNIRFGAWYIRFLLDRFGDDFALVSGAYNAGAGRMGEWRERFQNNDLDEFIEQLPYDETRRHIKKVMHTYDVYRALYGDGESG